MNTLQMTLNTLLFYILIIGYFQVKSQCVYGDCENGSGTYIYPDKSRIEGDWKNGEPNGPCKVYYASGDIYEGTMFDGVLSGYGKYVFADGDYYEGHFKNDRQNGTGIYVEINGYSEEGKFTNDTLNGYATIKFSNGDKYVGYTMNNLPDGSGIYYFAEGDKFEGVYKSGKKNGQGTLYFAKGGTLKGIWVDGEYISGSNKSNSSNAKNIILPELNDMGVYEVNVTLNDVLKLDMIFDTGASEVYFTPDIVLTLIKTKTVTDDDLLEGAYFTDANGSVNKSIRFNLRSMRIGDIILENIPCAVSNNVDGLNLLGLSALRQLGNFEFDFNDMIIKVK